MFAINLHNHSAASLLRVMCAGYAKAPAADQPHLVEVMSQLTRMNLEASKKLLEGKK